MTEEVDSRQLDLRKKSVEYTTLRSTFGGINTIKYLHTVIQSGVVYDFYSTIIELVSILVRFKIKYHNGGISCILRLYSVFIPLGIPPKIICSTYQRYMQDRGKKLYKTNNNKSLFQYFSKMQISSPICGCCISMNTLSNYAKLIGLLFFIRYKLINRLSLYHLKQYSLRQSALK